MDTNQIRYFLALADELHFWRTSEKVFITQSALSRQIKSLENELGLELFERDKRNVKLTAAGEYLRGELTRISSDIEIAVRRAAQIARGEIGTLRIGHPASITFSVLPEILQRFAAVYPEITVQMFEADPVNDDPSLISNRVDIAFNRDTAKAAELESRHLMTEKFALVVPANHDLADAAGIDLCDLRDEWFVLPSLQGKSEHAAQLRAIFAAAGFEPRVRYESDFGATLLGLVAKGLGISVMPYSYSHYLTDEVRFREIDADSSLYVTWNRNDRNAVLANFLAIIEESFGT